MTTALIDNQSAPANGFSEALAESGQLGTGANATASPHPFTGKESHDFPEPGTPEWGRLNRRRGELIEREVDGGLSSREADELAWLQRETLAAVDRAFPRPPVNLRALAELEERLKKGARQEMP